ncbi:MAG: hypothetical protein JEZ11_18670 [Desulfobacterales bacterium]|nr:hypothetical protein [Desulfobacterales bacterium]
MKKGVNVFKRVGRHGASLASDQVTTVGREGRVVPGTMDRFPKPSKNIGKFVFGVNDNEMDALLKRESEGAPLRGQGALPGGGRADGFVYFGPSVSYRDNCPIAAIRQSTIFEGLYEIIRRV